jgi:hypothetical protein
MDLQLCPRLAIDDILDLPWEGELQNVSAIVSRDVVVRTERVCSAADREGCIVRLQRIPGVLGRCSSGGSARGMGDGRRLEKAVRDIRRKT